MTATTAPDLRPTPWFPVALQLARRGLVSTWRVPAAFLPLFLMPIFFVVAFGGSFSGLTQLPHFPTDNILSWMVPFAIVQGAAFAGMGSAFGAVRDMESGFYDRLLLMPGSRAAIMAAPALAGVVRVTLTVVVVTGFGAALGASFPGGPLGMFVLWVAAVGSSWMSAAWGLGVAYRIPSSRSMPIVQVGIFFPTFLSTGNVPLADQTGWVRNVARVNPVTNILELARQGLLGHVSWATTWPGLVAIGCSLVVLWAFAARGIRRLTP